MKWFLKRVLAAAAALALVLAGAGVLIRVQYNGEPKDWAVSNGTNALWMGHAWVDGRNGSADLAKLARRVTDGEISDVYVHVGPVDHDGTLRKTKYPKADAFLKEFREQLPDVRVSAWVGQRVEDGKLDLSDDASRERVVDGAGDLVDAGFDGVHYNFEPVPNNDPGLVDLLDSTREALPGDALLSTSVPQIEPLTGMALPLGLIFGVHKYWSSTYLRRVADKVDQVAVMSYDTGMPLEGMYGGFVVRQTRLALDTVPKDVQIFMGVPAYPDSTVIRNPDAETPATATRAMRLGLSEESKRRERFGAAVYADFSAKGVQWDAYERGWVTPGTGGGG